MPTQTQISPADFDKLHRYYLSHPDEFVIDVLGTKPWQKQVEIIQSTFRHKYTAVKTCNGVGKSYVAARIVITYLMLYPNSIVVTTAPTWRQVTDILWREIGTALKKAKYKLTDKEAIQAGLNLDTNWYAVGLSTKRPENFFGYHADHILVVVDEAGGVEEPIFKGVAAITPNANAHVLLIGNPTTPSGTFYEAFNNPKLGYKCFTISAFDSPNFTAAGIATAEDLLTLYAPRNGTDQAEWTTRVNERLDKLLDPTYGSLIHPSVVYARYYEWGVDSPAWQALVMGEFPSQAEQALFPTELVVQSMQMRGIDDATGKTFAELSGWDIPDGLPEYGQDMARYGNDNCVCFPRHGGWVDEPIVWGKTSLDASGDRILNLIDPMDPNTRVNIDDSGNGGGTTDHMRRVNADRIKNGLPPFRYQLVAYNWGSKESMSDHDREKFHDFTAWLYWNLKVWLEKKRIALPKNQRLFDELVARRWWLNKSGKIQVESKDEYKKRTGGKSPDYCLVGGTMILTDKGYRPIEAIRAGDKVVTPFGTRRVLDAGMTSADAEVSTVTFSNGITVTGTPGHKMIAGGKICTIDTLPLYNEVYTDRLIEILIWRIRHLFDIKARHIGFRQRIEGITPLNYPERMAAALSSNYIGQSGKTHTGARSQRDTSFTILTTTLSIIALKTSLLWRGLHIPATTWRNITASIKRSPPSFLTGSDPSRKRGTLLQRALSGIGRMVRNPGRRSRLTRSSASIAVKSAPPHSPHEQSSAPVGVPKPTKLRRNTTGQQNVCAYIARGLSRLIGINQPRVVVERVATDTGRQAVYNLTVEKDGVYYANGVLVSNCDALALAFAGGHRILRSSTPLSDPAASSQPTVRPMTAGVTQRF